MRENGRGRGGGHHGVGAAVWCRAVRGRGDGSIHLVELMAMGDMYKRGNCGAVGGCWLDGLLHGRSGYTWSRVRGGRKVTLNMF